MSLGQSSWYRREPSERSKTKERQAVQTHENQRPENVVLITGSGHA